MHVLVLGSAAGGGYPQWNCRCPVCLLAWQGDPRVRVRSQSSVAVSSDGRTWVLLNASPDLRQQVIDNRSLHPRQGFRNSPIVAVVLTNGDVDHVAGLLSLRERQPFALHASAAILELLAADAIFQVLHPDAIRRVPMLLDEPSSIAGLQIRPFAVPGKVPLFLEGERVDVGTETEMTIGLDIRSGDRRFIYVPGCAGVTRTLVDRIEGADLLLFDGTTFTDDEMPALGLSDKTAARMGHIAMDGPGGSLEGLATTAVARKIFTHINNTNPVLIDGSPERRRIEAAGWEIAFDGMAVTL